MVFQQPFKVVFFTFRLLVAGRQRILRNVITSIVDAEFGFQKSGPCSGDLIDPDTSQRPNLGFILVQSFQAVAAIAMCERHLAAGFTPMFIDPRTCFPSGKRWFAEIGDLIHLSYKVVPSCKLAYNPQKLETYAYQKS
jgi:hypothetical protein